MMIRDRIKELRRVRASELKPHPKNWRTHPAAQREVNVPESFQVAVECRDEAEQRAVFERMTGEGYKCRVLTL
jgi:hypothetical protein